MVIVPFLMLKASWTDLGDGSQAIGGARRVETILCLAESYLSWFTPMTIVISSLVAGAE